MENLLISYRVVEYFSKNQAPGRKKHMIVQSRKMENVPFSPIRKIFAEVDRMKKDGLDIISLGIGEPDFDTPSHITEAMAAATRGGATHYTANKGILALREAICRKLKVEDGLEYDPEEIICTVGVSEGVFVSLGSFLDPGDEVLVPDPSWVSYSHIPVMNGAVPKGYPLREENDFQIDVADLERLLTPKTKILVLLDPSNPVGSVQKKEALEKVAEFAVRNDLLVISDEIYEKIIYDGKKHISIASFPGMRERTIVLNGFAKAYAMTGWRIGYIAAPAELVAVMNRMHMYMVTHTGVQAQWGALAALEGPQDPVVEMVEEFRKRRDFVCRRIDSMEKVSCRVPGGAFYVFLNIRETGMNAEEFTRFLLREAHVAVVPGTAFGVHGEGYVRISYAVSHENLEKAMDRMENALQSL